MTFKKGQSGNPAGKPKGIPNKATQNAREAIAMFVDGNAHRLIEWLDSVASDVVINGVVVRKGDPAKAFDMFMQVVEYHVPKLARTENVGDNGGPVEYVLKWGGDSQK